MCKRRLRAPEPVFIDIAENEVCAEPVTGALIESYLGGELVSPQKEEFEQHLCVCKMCHAQAWNWQLLLLYIGQERSRQG